MSLQEKPLPADDSAASLKAALAERTRELAEARERETATAEILKVIKNSPGDVAPVFDAIVERAMRLCQAAYRHVYTYDGELFHLASAQGERGYVDWIRQSGPRVAASSLTFERIVAGEQLAHIGDIAADDAYRKRNPRALKLVDRQGIHTF